MLLPLLLLFAQVTIGSSDRYFSDDWCSELLTAAHKHMQETRPACRKTRNINSARNWAASSSPSDALAIWGHGDLNPVFLSLLGEDWWIYVNHARFMKRRGVYVDLATNHPLVISNTFVLDKCLGWEGICIEPNSVHHNAIKAMRTCKLVDAVMTSAGTSQVQLTSTAGALDAIGGRTHVGAAIGKDGKFSSTTHSVRADTLANTFAEHGVTHVDFLSLDIEGHEPVALLGMAWANVTVDIIICENPKAAKMLEEQGYRRVDYIRSNGRIPTQEGQAVYLREGFNLAIDGNSVKTTVPHHHAYHEDVSMCGNHTQSHTLD